MFDGLIGQQRWQASGGGVGTQWLQPAMMANCEAAARQRQGDGGKEEDADTTIKWRGWRWRLAAEVNSCDRRLRQQAAAAGSCSGSGCGSGTCGSSGDRAATVVTVSYGGEGKSSGSRTK